MASENYLIDVGGPWTSDKAMLACSVCGVAMLVPLDAVSWTKSVAPIHKSCLAAIQKRPGNDKGK